MNSLNCFAKNISYSYDFHIIHVFFHGNMDSDGRFMCIFGRRWEIGFRARRWKERSFLAPSSISNRGRTAVCAPGWAIPVSAGRMWGQLPILLRDIVIIMTSNDCSLSLLLVIRWPVFAIPASEARPDCCGKPWSHFQVCSQLRFSRNRRETRGG